MIDRLVRGRIHYGWLIVSVTFVTLITTAGFRATPGVLIVPLQDEFGWIATVPPTVAIAADTFGRERVGVVFGWIFASHQLGAAFAAWAAGASRGWFGSYNPAFLAVGGICLVASALVMRITLSPRERLPEPAAA